MLASRLIGIVCIAMVLDALAIRQASLPAHDAAQRSEIFANDNLTPAGVLQDGVLTVALVAAAGTWFPGESDGPGHEVYAFGEAGRTLQNPGPALRVPVGTVLRISLRNGIAGAPLVVHGLHDRPGPADTVQVPVGATRRLEFRVSEPGTYFYWATTRNAQSLPGRWGMESQLMGALIVDPAGRRPADHVFVIGIETDSAERPAERPLRSAVVNGRSWPHSHQSTVQQGDTVLMRWINASDRPHPMHLHGFYFRIDGRGDIARDTIHEADQQRMAVTELLTPGQTMSIRWVPDRPGNWIMHCHMTEHISPHLRRGARHASDNQHARNHTLDVMSGLVTGWRVIPADNADKASTAQPEPRKIRLLVQSAPGRYGADPGVGFVIQSGAKEPRPDSVVIPGPPLVLVRGQPVQITVVNHLREPTSIHWHGLELDSYFDGVSGYSGHPGRIAPQIEVGDSFAVQLTPPRAGTFIYHSHFEEARQLSSGLYGPLIVLDPGDRYDPQTDRVWLLSQSGPGEGRREVRVMLNGSRSPVIDFETGRRYRIRLININPNIPIRFSMLHDSVPASWRAVAKDGANLPPAQRNVQRATQLIGVGEVYDFEFTPEAPRDLKLLLTDPAGAALLMGTVRMNASGSGNRKAGNRTKPG